MSTPKAVRALNHDLSRYRAAQHQEAQAVAAGKKANAAAKTDSTNETQALAKIQQQEQAIIDQFTSSTPPDAATAKKLLGQLFALGQKDVQTQDTFKARIAADHANAAKANTQAKHDASLAKADRKQALKDLKPAEYQLSLKETNRDRKELGRKAISKPVRVQGSAKLAKAVKLALQAAQLEAKDHCYDYTEIAPGRTNDGLGPVTRKSNGRMSFDCSGFCGALYKAAGLPPPYTVGYGGTTRDIQGCKNMVKVPASKAQPGDLVLFPGHIAIYIGHGKCVSMGFQGEPRVQTVSDETAWQHGIVGYFHPKHA